MAKTKKNEETTVNDVVIEKPVEYQIKKEEPLNLDQQVTVRSIAGWRTGFRRIQSIGDVSIPPRGIVRLSRSEIIAQVQNGNKLFGGFGENLGDHATLIIEDAATIRELGMENAKTFNDDVVKELFAIRGYDEFLSALQEKILTRAECYAAMISIDKLGLNDYSKIRAFEDHTGFKMDKIRENIR